MPLHRRSLVFLAVAFLGTACSQSTAPGYPWGAVKATLAVQRDTLVATVVSGGRVSWIEFTVPVVIHNPGPLSLDVGFCTYGVDGAAGDGWHPVWRPYCALVGNPPANVPPGESREIAVTVMAALEGPAAPKWENGTIEGTYRFVAGMVTPGFAGRVSTVASNSFTLIREGQGSSD